MVVVLRVEPRTAKTNADSGELSLSSSPLTVVATVSCSEEPNISSAAADISVVEVVVVSSGFSVVVYSIVNSTSLNKPAVGASVDARDLSSAAADIGVVVVGISDILVVV